jgi:hypothetical protein
MNSSRYSRGYTTQWRIHSGRYTAADTQQYQTKIHGRMKVFDAELWAIGLALDVTIEK